MRKKMTLAKWVGLGAVGVLLGVLVLSHSGASSHTHTSTDQTSDNPSNTVGVSTNEELRYLTEGLHKLTEQNQQVLKDNQVLKAKLARSDHQPALVAEQQHLQAVLANQQHTLHALTAKIAALNAQSSRSNYRLNQGAGAKGQASVTTHVITTVQDLSLPALPDKTTASGSGYQPLLPTAKAGGVPTTTAAPKQAAKTIPYYTIPANATLGDVVLMNSILGIVPVNNKLEAPAFPFKALVGRDALLASNGLHLPPNLKGMVVTGYSIGNMTMRCARGYITSVLFTWDDGSFTVYPKQPIGNDSLNPQNALGYISTPDGNPCLPGQYLTDAPKVIASIAALGGLAGGANAFAQGETTESSSVYGPISQVTGNAFKYMGGKTVATGADKALSWYTDRVKGILDVVAIPASIGHRPTHIVVNITQTIPIDQNQHGRKLDYAQGHSNRLATRELD